MKTPLLKSTNRLVALAALAGVVATQAACYNTYFIDKDELRKLESSVEPREVVEVYGDCPATTTASRYRVLDGTMWAQNDAAAPAEGAPAAEGETASDATSTQVEPGYEGCTKVPVSTANTLKIVLNDGEERRVTPFNFVMSDTQIVSPEYDMLESLNQVDGAEVKQFSTGKTVGTIIGVAAVSIGTFVGISLIAEEGQGFR